MLAGKAEKLRADTAHRVKRGLRHKLRQARGATESCGANAWLASVSPPALQDDAAYLESFGYAATDSQTWEDLPQDEVPEGLARSGPWLGLGIAEHREAGGHTWYQVECSLAVQGLKTVEWQVGRRLQHLRDLWYGRIKSELGKSYRQHFDDIHFAHRGGCRGTSERLHTWCCRLASRINAGQLSPAIVALTLRFLEAPDATGQAGLHSAPERTAEGERAAVPKALQASPKRPPEHAGRCSAATGGEESVSSRSTRCSLSDGDRVLATLSGSDGSDGSDCEEEEYESDFETDSGSSEED